MRTFPGAALLMLSFSCVHGPAGTPDEAFRQYRAALEREDPQAAYALLDPAARPPYPAFVAQWQETAPERAAELQVLRERGTASLPVHAAVSFAGGVRLTLDARSGGFCLSHADLRSAHPQTPEEAIRLLIQAAEQRSYEAVLRLLAPGQRKAIKAELEERIACLRAALSRRQPAELLGDRARFQCDSRFHVLLQKEHQTWWILDLN